jgi:hypothetical protein
MAFAATPAGIRGELTRNVLVETLMKRLREVRELPTPAQWLSDNGSGYILGEMRASLKTFRSEYVHFDPTPHARRSHSACLD